MKMLGAVGNKLLSFHSDVSDFSHKKIAFHGEMMVSSGIKEGTPMTM